jgi:hypothetical protein
VDIEQINRFNGAAGANSTTKRSTGPQARSTIQLPVTAFRRAG